ncbi:hypothetical protein ACM26V_16795 [Salipaludibacillus sp. HK11]|uniref:hypothetical protein n=1 Tax=Salipaludibacillus sp. HK11 TaxID=3394320 RepID=UPI0039FCEBB3
MYYKESLEYKAETIQNQNTREYFDEVLSSYHNGNYRSAVVMLYSVVVCDLIYKLNELKDRYSDATAEGILTEIESIQEKEPENSKWETRLIELVKGRTNLFETNDKVNIDYLRKQRHLSAHPVLTTFDILHKPSKETARALMMNMLDGLLIKSPLLSKKIIGTFLEDLKMIKDDKMTDEQLSKYLNNRYFDKLNKPTEQKLFKDLWKFSFKLDDEDSEENREIIFRALRTFYLKNIPVFNELIESDKSYYSDIKYTNSNIIMIYTSFLSLYPKIYVKTEEQLKAVLERKSENDFNVFTQSVFLSTSLEQHFINIKDRLYGNGIVVNPRICLSSRNLLFFLSQQDDILAKFLDLLIEIFRRSHSFDLANVNFEEYILEYGAYFSKVQLEEILSAINSNDQINERRRASIDNKELKEIIEERYKGEIDYEQYPNFEC